MRRHFIDRCGREIIIRQAAAADVAGLIGLSNDIRAEGIYFVAEEPRLSADEWAEYLHFLNSERNLVLAALDAERLIGSITVVAGRLRKTRHVAEVGLGVAAPYRGAGIGSALMGLAIDWSGAQGLLRLELSVFANNERALALYRKFGFAEEGRRRAKYLIDGVYVDEVIMGRLLR